MGDEIITESMRTVLVTVITQEMRAQIMTPVPGSSVLFCLKRNKGLVRNSR